MGESERPVQAVGLTRKKTIRDAGTVITDHATSAVSSSLSGRMKTWHFLRAMNAPCDPHRAQNAGLLVTSGKIVPCHVKSALKSGRSDRYSGSGVLLVC
jgi:hypothetical protein